MIGVPKGYCVDWQRVLLDLRAAGFTNAMLEERLDIASGTLRGYRDYGAQPTFGAGSRIVVLWCECKGGGVTAENLPIVQDLR